MHNTVGRVHGPRKIVLRRTKKSTKVIVQLLLSPAAGDVDASTADIMVLEHSPNRMAWALPAGYLSAPAGVTAQELLPGASHGHQHTECRATEPSSILTL